MAVRSVDCCVGVEEVVLNRVTRAEAVPKQPSDYHLTFFLKGLVTKSHLDEKDTTKMETHRVRFASSQH